MRKSSLSPIEPALGRNSTSGWVSWALLAVGVPWGTLSAFALLGGNGSQLVAFDAAAGWFMLLAVSYLGLHGLSGLAWCSVPVLLTLRAVVEFICVPAWRFATGDDLIDSVYVRAVVLTVIGFAGLWAGSLVWMKESRLRFAPTAWGTSSRVALLSAAMLGLGVGGKLVLWKTRVFSYIADVGLRESTLWYLQWLGLLADLLNAALIVSAIELLGKRSTEPLIKVVFWISLICSIGFGAMSGMKTELMQPLLYILLVFAIARGRMPRQALLLPVLAMLIYPFVNAYRENLANGYRFQINTVAGLTAALDKSWADVVKSPFSAGAKAEDGLDQTTSRLSLLTYVRDIVGLPDPSLMNGDESIWLTPFYPLVPRVLWKDKPVFNKGQRLSLALGRPSTTSSAVTPIGDLYSMYGTYGLAAGMVIYGMCLQLYANWINRGLSEKRLFIYIWMLMPLINLENDVAALVTMTVQTGLILAVLSYVIYGESNSSLSVTGDLSSVGAS